DGGNSMTRGKNGKLHAICYEECAAENEERASAPLDESCKGRLEIAFAVNSEGKDFEPERASRGLHVFQLGLCIRIVSLTEHGDRGYHRCSSSSCFAPSCWMNGVTPVMLPPGRFKLATSPSLTGSDPAPKNDGNGGCRPLRRRCRHSASRRRDHRDPALNEI